MPARVSTELTKRIIDAAQPGCFLWDGGTRGVSGLCLRVTPAGSRSFTYRYRNTGGKQCWVKLGSYPAITVEQARALASERAGEVAKGNDPSKARRTLREAPTVTTLAEYYLGPYALSKGLRESTLRDARNVLNRALPAIASMKVAEVTTADIRRLCTKLRLASGKHQANRLRATLSAMFNLAEKDWGIRSGNPCKGVDREAEDQRWRNLSEDEVGRLLDACDAYEIGNAMEGEARNAADAIRLLLFTGARLREVLRAEWRQFDLERGLWEKPSSHTKTRRQHRLELDGPALDLLRDMHRRRRHARFLFPGDPGKARGAGTVGEIKPRVDLKRPWTAIVREAALEDVRIHDLRRTTASFMLSGGASLATVGKSLGHTQPSTTARYAHLQASVQREGLRAAGERMAALRGRPGTSIAEDASLEILVELDATRRRKPQKH